MNPHYTIKLPLTFPTKYNYSIDMREDLQAYILSFKYRGQEARVLVSFMILARTVLSANEIFDAEYEMACQKIDEQLK